MTRTCRAVYLENPQEARFRAVRVLNAARKFLSLTEISELTSITPSILSRYHRGVILPTSPNAMKILDSLLEKSVIARILSEVMERRSTGSGYINLKGVLGDPALLTLLGEHIVYATGGCFDFVIAPEAGGISLATSVALSSGRRLVIARRQKPLEAPYIEVPVLRDPVNVEYFYLSRHDLTVDRKNRCCESPTAVIVDDFTIHGVTLKGIADALSDAGIEVAKIFVAVGMGGSWKKLPQAEAVLEIG